MTGNRKVGLVLQERDRQLLRELGTMRVVDCEQTRIVVGFSSIRRTNRRLLKLTRAGLLRRIFIGSAGHGQKALYTLSPKGAALVDAKLPGLPVRQSPFGTSPFLLHRLAINEIYLAVKHQRLPRPDMRCSRWIGFRSHKHSHSFPMATSNSSLMAQRAQCLSRRTWARRRFRSGRRKFRHTCNWRCRESF